MVSFVPLLAGAWHFKRTGLTHAKGLQNHREKETSDVYPETSHTETQKLEHDVFYLKLHGYSYVYAEWLWKFQTASGTFTLWWLISYSSAENNEAKGLIFMSDEQLMYLGSVFFFVIVWFSESTLETLLLYISPHLCGNLNFWFSKFDFEIYILNW